MTELERLGVRLWLESGQLRFRAPQGVMTPERRDALRARREELVAHLADGGLPALTADPAGRHEPFPLSDVQSAYLLGRGRAFAYGGVGCHGYGELRYPALEPDRMRQAWQAVVQRHDMLRAVVELDGSQRVLPEVPPFELRGAGPAGQARRRGVARAARRSGTTWTTGCTPSTPGRCSTLRVTLADDFAVMHVSIDFLVADFVSIQVLLDEVHHHYHAPRPAAAAAGRDVPGLPARRAEAARRRRSTSATARTGWTGSTTLPAGAGAAGADLRPGRAAEVPALAGDRRARAVGEAARARRAARRERVGRGAGRVHRGAGRVEPAPGVHARPHPAQPAAAAPAGAGA